MKRFMYMKNNSIYMKKHILKLSLALAVVVDAGFAVYSLQTSKELTGIGLDNMEALASGENGEKNIFTSYVWSEDCYIYVGGAYARGKKVTCCSGSEHPVCIDCQL